MKIGIVGLGLIGGSMAKALRSSTNYEIFANDKNAEVQKQALADGVIDGLLDKKTLSDCNVLFLALYPTASINFIKQNAKTIKNDSCVVDLCGVKRVVSRDLIPLSLEHGFHFVGGHPMAGREKSGYGAAVPDLFKGASMILTPHDKIPKKVVSELDKLFSLIGFSYIHISDDETHDRLIAYTSQLAHVLSNAYVKSPLALEHKGFSAGSFQDLTRVATLNAQMWTELFLNNKDFLLQEINALCKRLSEYGLALQNDDAESLYKLLQEGSEQKAKTL